MSTHEHTGRADARIAGDPVRVPGASGELHRMPAIIQRRRTYSPVRYYRPFLYAGRMGHFTNAALAGVR